MIYCLDPKNYPNENQSLEEIVYKDENDFEWRIARIVNGFFVKYFGDEYFKDSTFEIETKNSKHISIKNTNCIFIQSSDFETFAEVRNVIKIGYTDDIWETFSEMLEERFNYDDLILESEAIDTKKDYFDVSLVQCDLCNHTWVAVRPHGLTELECPNCNNIANFTNKNQE